MMVADANGIDRSSTEVSVDARGSLLAGRYRLVDLVGSGGMGAVWEAWDERLDRRVALKQLHPQPQLSDADAERSTRRAMREARITARLHHPNAVPIFDVVEHEGRPCLIMQFLPSRPLSTVLREDGPMRPADVARIGAQVASALAAAHDLGIVHRDVKPGNVLIIDDGRAMLSDFGISHALGDDALTTTGVVHGTPAYLAPEVARGADSSFASDVYSLGGTLYAAVEGRPPFGTEQNSMALLHRIASGEIVPPSRSGALAPELLRMLSPEPSDRPSMPEVARVLDGMALSTADEPPAASEDPAPARPRAGVVTSRMTPETLPVTVSVPTPAAMPGVRSRRHRRLRTVAPALLVVTVLLAIAVGIAALVNGLNGHLPTAADRAGATTTPDPSGTATRPAAAVPSTKTAAASPSSTPTATASPSTASPSTARPTTARPTTARPTTARPTSAPPTTAPRTTAPPSTPPASTPGPSSNTQLASAVTSYYALLPLSTDAGWSRLTASYQSGRARSRQSYDRFWGAVRRVSVSAASGESPNRAQATITYVFADGRTVRERTSFGLVQDGSILKIDTSTVLSSTTE